MVISKWRKLMCRFHFDTIYYFTVTIHFEWAAILTQTDVWIIRKMSLASTCRSVLFIAWNANGWPYSSHKFYLGKYSNVCVCVYCQSALSLIKMIVGTLISHLSSGKLPNTITAEKCEEKNQKWIKINVILYISHATAPTTTKCNRLINRQ